MTSEETRLRRELCLAARSLFERGLTNGSSGNISARLSDGSILVTPTGSSLGRLDPGKLSKVDRDFKHISGDPPTKEMPLHQAFYEARGSSAGAVVHLHCTYSVILSIQPGVDPADAIPPLTAYAVMRLGKVALVPFFPPGSAEMGMAVRKVATRHSSILLRNHGPVVAGSNLDQAIYRMEELEESAKLAFLTRGTNPHRLSPDQMARLARP